MATRKQPDPTPAEKPVVKRRLRHTFEEPLTYVITDSRGDRGDRVRPLGTVGGTSISSDGHQGGDRVRRITGDPEKEA